MIFCYKWTPPLWTPCYTERFSSVPTMFRLDRFYCIWRFLGTILLIWPQTNTIFEISTKIWVNWYMFRIFSSTFFLIQIFRPGPPSGIHEKIIAIVTTILLSCRSFFYHTKTFHTIISCFLVSKLFYHWTYFFMDPWRGTRVKILDEKKCWRKGPKHISVDSNFCTDFKYYIRLRSNEENCAQKSSNISKKTSKLEIRCVRRMSAETRLSTSEGKVADIGGINILKRGRLQHLWTLNDLYSL